MENMFEMATKMKLRFPYKGLISVEDLWDLSAEKLDGIFKVLNAQVKQVKEESLLNKKTAEDKVLDLQINIIKYIVKVKLDEADAKLKAKALKEEEQKILSVLAEKNDEAIKNMSKEELEKKLAEIQQQKTQL